MSLLDEAFQTPGEHERNTKGCFRSLPNWGGGVGVQRFEGSDHVTLLSDPLLPPHREAM